ncbi:hypothetical protein D3C72_1367000 [compost metagenome]
MPQQGTKGGGIEWRAGSRRTHGHGRHTRFFQFAGQRHEGGGQLHQQFGRRQLARDRLLDASQQAFDLHQAQVARRALDTVQQMARHAAAATFQFGRQHGGAVAIGLHEAANRPLQGFAAAPQGDAALPVDLARGSTRRRAGRRRRHGHGDIEQAGDFCRQLVHFQRFRGKAVHAGRLRGAPVLFQHAGRQGDDGRRLQTLFALVHADQTRRF